MASAFAEACPAAQANAQIILAKNIDGLVICLSPATERCVSSRSASEAHIPVVNRVAILDFLRCGAHWRKRRKRFGTVLIHLWETRHRPACFSTRLKLCQRRKAAGKVLPLLVIGKKHLDFLDIAGFFSPAN
jgi:hypothetical protein